MRILNSDYGLRITDYECPNTEISPLLSDQSRYGRLATLAATFKRNPFSAMNPVASD
jgi:hypothetical protein